MLRLLVALLLLANLLFFGWTRGWLGTGMPPPQHGQREPERLAAQVRPELIVLMPLPTASAPSAAAEADAAPASAAAPAASAAPAAPASAPASAPATSASAASPASAASR